MTYKIRKLSVLSFWAFLVNVMWLLTIFTNLYIITTCCYCPPSCRRVSDYRGLLRLPGLWSAAWSQRGPGPSPSQIAGPDTDNRRVLPFQLTVTNKDEMRIKQWYFTLFYFSVHSTVCGICCNICICQLLWSSGKGKGKGSTQEGHSKVIYRL